MRELPPAKHGEAPMPSASDHSSNVLLRNLERTAPLSADERQAVRNLPAIIKSLPAGSDLVHEGERSTQACIVLSGWIGDYKIVSQGRRQVLAFHVAGDMPDLQSLHLSVADFSMTALTDASLAFIPHAAVRGLTARYPTLAAAFWRENLIDAAIFRQWMTGIGRRSAFERITHLFCEMYLRQQAAGLAKDHVCPLPVTQSDLADATGMTSVHVSRVLREVRKQKLATWRLRTLTIHDWGALVEASGFDPCYLHFAD